MRYASLVGYEKSVLEGIRSGVQKEVMRCLFEFDDEMTRRMIEVRTGIRISTVTGAVKCLLDSGLIEVCTQDGIDPISGFKADFVRPVWPQPATRQAELAGFAKPMEYP
jgi:hypothetical protein